MSEPFGAVGNGRAMAGNVESTADAAATIEPEIAAAFAAAKQRMADAERFIVEHGVDVSGGHATVGVPPGGRVWEAGNAPFANDPGHPEQPAG